MMPDNRATSDRFRPFAEVAREIRHELKRRFGWTREEVRIRTRGSGLEDVIRIRIQAPGVPVSRVKHIAAPHARIRRDHDGDILGGGNRFVFVALGYEAFAAFVEPLRAKLEALPLATDEPAEIRAGRYRFLVTRYEVFGRSRFVFADDYLHRQWDTFEALSQMAHILAQSRRWRQLLAELTP